MGLYNDISGAAVLVNIFIFLIILNSKGSKIRNIFLALIGISILWTGGSFLMRNQVYPSYEFWYHISLLGIFLMPVVYFRFIMEYTNDVKVKIIYIYLALMIIAFIINLFTGLLIPPPTLSVLNGVETLVYEEFGFTLYILLVIVISMILHMLYWFYVNIKKNPKIRKISKPVIIGIAALFLGNLLVLVPLFNSFPIDIVAALVNAFALLYALMRRSPFKLQMATSETTGYVTCLLLTFLTLFVIYPAIYEVLGLNGEHLKYYTISLIILFSIIMTCYYIIWRTIIIGVFVKEEDLKSELVNQYSSDVQSSLDIEIIVDASIKILEEVISPLSIQVAVKRETEYQLQYSNRLLDDISITFTEKSYLIEYIIKNFYLNMSDFKYEYGFKALLKQEQEDLEKLDATHIFGLFDGTELLGLLILSDSKLHKKIQRPEIIRIQSICTMFSAALKNASSYEKAIVESQTDNVTQLYNRKHFYTLLEMTFKRHYGNNISLVMINVDDFKLYNQLYGMENADIALATIASIIKKSVKGLGHAARFSGKEFVLLLPNMTTKQTLELLKNIILSSNKCVKDNDGRLKKIITYSIGLCTYPDGAKTIGELVENTQHAVYQVKQNGKNNIKVFDAFEHEESKSLNKSKGNEYWSTIYALTAAIDAKDHYTFNHSENVAKYAVAFAKKLAFSNEIVENIRQAALLHDIGKISIPEHILNKPGRLNEEEYKEIQGHVDASIDIIRHLPSLDYVIPAVLGHHERYDGNGYPRRMSGEDIPITARILCLADSVDAMLTKRAYKPERTVEEVITVLKMESGKQFDPELTTIFIEMMKNDDMFKHSIAIK